MPTGRNKTSILLLLLLTISYVPSPSFAATNFRNVAGTAGLDYQHADLTADVMDLADDMATMSGGAAAASASPRGGSSATPTASTPSCTRQRTRATWPAWI